MKKLAVIVPCYNEELVIAESYRRTREALHKLPVLTEIIYINDGSRDRTRLMLDEIAASDPQVKVIHFSRNFGHQPAVTAGINNCDADLAVILDADNRILAALKIMPPRKALPNDPISACAKLSRNPCPSEPKLPNVKAEKTEKSNTPIT